MVRRLRCLLTAALVAVLAVPAVAAAQFGPVVYSQSYHGCWQFGCSDATIQLQSPAGPLNPNIETIAWSYDLVPFQGEGAVPWLRSFPCDVSGDPQGCQDAQFSNCFGGIYPTAPTNCSEFTQVGPAFLDFDPRSPTVSVTFFIGPSGEYPSDWFDFLRPDERLGTLQLTATPEPASLALLAGGLGMFGMLGVAARRRRGTPERVEQRVE